jgi:hypothetical protein
MRLAISPRSRSICGSTIEPKIDRLEVESELTPVGQSDGTGNYFSQATFIIGLQGECSMCDYSLHAVKSRAAKAGDRLISARFPGTETRGFAAVGEPGVAVCLLPGTELVFEREIETVHAFAPLLPSFGFGMQGERLARFRRVDPRQPHAHRDALELANGRLVLVTRLREGQCASVLQLPANSQFSTADGGHHQLTDETSSPEIAHATDDSQ